MGTVSKITKFVLAILMTITSINLSFVYADEPTTSNATEGESLPTNNDDTSNEEVVNSENTSESTDVVEGVQDEEIQSEGASVENEESISTDSQAEVEATQAIAETASNDEGTTDESTTVEESSEEKTVDTMSSDELFAYIMTLDTDQLDALYDEYKNLDDLMANFTEEQQAELENKFGNGEEDIELVADYGYYDAKITASTSNATVTYYYWHTANETTNVRADDFETATGTVKLSNFNSSDSRGNTSGYVLFFVKPNENYLVTGLGASGNGDIYPLKNNSNWGNISNYPGLENVVAAAKKAGYVATFGYSRKPGEAKLDGNFEIVGKSPEAEVTATSDKVDQRIKPGDKVTFTVKVTPTVYKDENGKVIAEATNVKVNKIKINKQEVSLPTLTKDSDGNFVGTVEYIATEEDCDIGIVTLTANVSTEYNCTLNKKDGDVKTSATITKEATTSVQIAKKNIVKYNFVSTTGEAVSSTVKNAFTPEDDREIYVGSETSPLNAKTTRFDVDDETEHGYWRFVNWDKSSAKMTEDGVTFTGTLEWVEKKGTAGYYLAIKSATLDTTKLDGISAVTESGKTKYYYDKKFAENDTFTVISEKPTAEGYYFIGWLDKERGNQAAAIRKAGDTVTYIYRTGSENTYCLDALWANIFVPNVDVTYDGKTHTVSEDIGINEGTSLDEKYKKQAKALITTNLTEYSTDNKTWSTEKPVFVDAGEYTVYVRKNVTVGDETTTLTGHGTVKISPATLTVTTNSAEKVYDGTPLTATGSMTGLVTVDGVKETATFTVEGSQTEKGSSKNSYKIVFSDKEVIGGTDTTTTNEENTNNKEANIALTSDGGSTAKSTNYTVSENVGTLTVTAQSLNPKKEDGSDDSAYKGVQVGTLKDVVYIGQSQTQIPTVKTKEGTALTKGTDYTVSYSNDTKNVGTVTVTITGIGNYKGSVTRTYKITPATVIVTTPTASKTYDGTALKAVGTITGLVNEETVTFTTTGSQTTTGSSANTYSLVWDGTAKSTNYTVSESVGTLTVTAKDITPDTPDTPEEKETGIVVNDPSNHEYDGKEHKEVLTVTDTKTDKTLVEGTDYEVSYNTEDFKNAGIITITVTGKGNYTGSFTKNYEITRKAVVVKANNNGKVYGNDDPTLYATKTGAVKGEESKISYSIAREAGEEVGNYTITVSGATVQGNYTVSYEEGTFTIVSKDITPDDKTGITSKDPDDVKYNGASQQQKPEINDTKTGKTLVEGTDYEVTYSEDTTNAGQVTVTITGIGNYTGEYTVTYNILKRDVTFTSPSASKTYDGSALTSTEIAISGEGFVEGEGASFNVTGTATEVGEVDNTFDYAMNEGTNADNYNVTVVNGKLTITAAPVVPSNDDATPTNNNTTPTRRTTPNRNTTPVAPETDSTPTATPEATVEPTATPEATATPEVIDDDETPEVAPKGNWALINLIAAMLSVLLGVIAILAKHKDEDEDEEDETEDENVSTRHRRWKIVSAIDAIVAVVAFILTEDITQKMVMVDKWTILMVVITLVGLVSTYLARKWHEEDEETSEDAQ